jgi:hypothetical protein
MLTLDDKIDRMNEIGTLAIRSARRFHWIIDHDVIRLFPDGSGEGVAGSGTNPYSALESHWRLLTGQGFVLYTRHPHSRILRWNGEQWISVPSDRAFRDRSDSDEDRTADGDLPIPAQG